MPNQPNPMVITLDHFNKLREHFKQHYFLSNCNANFGGQDIQIPWNSFAFIVQNFIASTQAKPDRVAFRFVHCFDSQKNELYLRLQLCTMVQDPAKPTYFKLDTTKCEWYTIEDGSIAPTGVTDLYDQNYLNNFYYCEADICSVTTLVNLASDKDATKFVRNQVFPWTQELYCLFTDNSNPQNTTICFAAGAHEGASPAVKYPHNLVIYLRQKDGTPLMDNTIYNLEFQMKAADYSTLCPSVCNVYILPQ